MYGYIDLFQYSDLLTIIWCHNGVCALESSSFIWVFHWLIGSFEDESQSTLALSSNRQTQHCYGFNPREIVAWVLVVIVVVLLIVSLIINVILSVWAYRRSNKSNDPLADCAVAMDSNPCYEAPNVKQTEAQEAVLQHVYEMVKQHNWILHYYCIYFNSH